MTTPTPSAPELIDAVVDWLRNEAMPLLAERRFEALVAANVLDIVARELRLGPDAEVASLERLRALLDSNAPASQLKTELSRSIRDADPSLNRESLHAHLWATTLDRLAIDQPKYAAYLREKRDGTPGGD